MLKQELRKKYKLLRKELSQHQIENLSLSIANHLLELPIWGHEFYHLYLSIVEHKEVNTEYILNILAGKDKNIVISKSDFESREMTHYLLTDSTRIKKTQWNIPEPEDGIEIVNNKIDVVFVPLLVFDRKGHRVGYGKGFYDKFLRSCRPETVKIGLSFFECEVEIDNVTADDVKLDFCITPDKIYRF